MDKEDNDMGYRRFVSLLILNQSRVQAFILTLVPNINNAAKGPALRWKMSRLPRTINNGGMKNEKININVNRSPYMYCSSRV